jgi:hypothetical protein
MQIYVKDSATPANYTLSNIDSITFNPDTTLIALHSPVLVLQFSENPVTHNMHIASDGQYLYTINGGVASDGKINKYTLAGVLVASYPIAIDGRGLSYNKADGFLYASLYEGTIVRITNLSTGTCDSVFPSKMTSPQAAFAISPDGTKMYDFYNGTVKVYNFSTGALLNTYTGLSCGTSLDEECIAVDNTYMYTWNASTKTVYVYTLAGTLVTSFVLPYGSYGPSLSVFDGDLFVSVDGDYNTGAWYGYNIRLPITLAKQIAPAALPSTSGNSATIPNGHDTTRK